MEGFLLIDKPEGLTSHDVVARVRRLTGEKRVGHAGTLDPFATGLLVVGVGRVATREFPKLVGLDKAYDAVFALGASSDTDDRTGKVSNIQSPISNTTDGVATADAMNRLTGPIEQVPPMYAAIKVDGKKLYELARAGKTVERKPRAVTIYSFDLLDADLPSPLLSKDGRALLNVRIRCSTGTYIRSLARDLGAALGTGGYVEELRRTEVGPFRVDEAVSLSSLSGASAIPLIPVQTLLSRLPPSATVPV